MLHDALLLDLLLDWTEDDTIRRKILHDNPAGLYGFIAAVLFAFGIYAAHRVRQGLAKPADQQTQFQPAMSHATPLAAGLDPRGPEDPAYDLSWEKEAEDGGKGWS